jgi:catechol 2,3-dioxygenase-like lactoylglutathione lyase family enzyme
MDAVAVGIRHPRRIAHVGLTVPRLEAAVEWYRRVLGFETIASPTEVRADVGHAGRLASAVFGPGFVALRQAHLGSASAVALELFEFAETNPAAAPDGFDYSRSGWFHLCVVDRDIEGLCRLIEGSGGRRLTAVMPIFEQGPYRMCYCQDPFGNVLEVYTHTHEQTYSNQPMPTRPAVADPPS